MFIKLTVRTCGRKAVDIALIESNIENITIGSINAESRVAFFSAEGFQVTSWVQVSDNVAEINKVIGCKMRNEKIPPPSAMVSLTDVEYGVDNEPNRMTHTKIISFALSDIAAIKCEGSRVVFHKVDGRRVYTFHYASPDDARAKFDALTNENNYNNEQRHLMV